MCGEATLHTSGVVLQGNPGRVWSARTRGRRALPLKTAGAEWCIDSFIYGETLSLGEPYVRGRNGKETLSPIAANIGRLAGKIRYHNLIFSEEVCWKGTFLASSSEARGRMVQ